MIKVLVLFALLLSQAFAYVPTVESLYRHGSNPEVNTNGVVITLKVSKLQPGERVAGETSDGTLLTDKKGEDFYKIFFSKTSEGLKVSQSRYNNPNFGENSLIQKVYYPNFNAYTMKPTIESTEKGLFFGLLNSLVYNNGAHLVNYLKTLGVPVKLNNEIINREKVELLVEYKKYLARINKDRSARKTEVNPLKPEDPAARERADAIMAQPMYLDMNQVSLSKDEGNIVWALNAGPFESTLSYKERDVLKIKYKSPAGDFDVHLKDYWLANGTHAFPRYMHIKTLNGEQYQVEVTNLRHFVERDEDLLKRLRNWDQILKGKESTEPRPSFLL